MEQSYSLLEAPRTAFFVSAVILFLFMQSMYGMPLPLHYVFIVSSMFLVLSSHSGTIRLNFSCILFLAAMVLSIVGNDIPDFFKPWQRLSLFAMMMVGCSPLIREENSDRVKRAMAIGALWALSGIALLSFVGYFLGFGRYMSGIVNSYMGITVHANFLGAFTMVATVWFATLYFRCTEMRERIFFGGCWAACIIVLLLASSRSSLAGGLAGTIIAVYLRFQRDAGKMLTSIIFGVVAVIVLLPHIAIYTEAMMKKNMDFDDTDTMVAVTRGGVWDIRYAEIAESPWIGVGAYACDVNLPGASIYYVKSTGTVELGSSYLGLLSQCGWIGFIAFLLVVIPIIWKTFRYATRECTPYSQLWLPILVVIAENMIFEGYATTAGAVQCIMLWLVLAAADQSDTMADYPVFWETFDPISPQEYVNYKENET